MQNMQRSVTRTRCDVMGWPLPSHWPKSVKSNLCSVEAFEKSLYFTKL